MNKKDITHSSHGKKWVMLSSLSRKNKNLSRPRAGVQDRTCKNDYKLILNFIFE